MQNLEGLWVKLRLGETYRFNLEDSGDKESNCKQKTHFETLLKLVYKRLKLSHPRENWRLHLSLRIHAREAHGGSGRSRSRIVLMWYISIASNKC